VKNKYHDEFEDVMCLIRAVKPKFRKDGPGRYYFFLGEYLEDSISGFGRTGWGAALDFYRHFFNETM
jgi:hypothetical protein